MFRRNFRWIDTLVVALLLGACGEKVVDDAATPARGPLLGVAAGTDAADHGCRVVLRSLARVPGPTGGYLTSCNSRGCWFVWQGTLEVSAEALAAGATPIVLFQNVADGTWWSGTVAPTATAGRYTVTLDDHTVPDGMSTTSLMRTVIQVAPAIVMPDQSRLFDHNRNAGDFDNYVLDQSNTWSTPDAPAVCAAPARSTLRFLADWRQVQEGAIVAGGKLTVEYDLARLPQCVTSTYNGMAAWATLAWARFWPGGAVVSSPLTQLAGDTNLAAPAQLDVPADATAVELWFETSGETCTTGWDSAYGANYHYAVAAAPTAASVGWAGDWGSMVSRGCAPGDLQADVPDPLVLDSWALTRATCLWVDVDVWVPGVTDGAALRPELLQAQVAMTRDGDPTRYGWLDFVGQVGNNYRYRWDLGRAGLDFVNVPWSQVAYAFRFSTDGNRWFQVARGAGPDGGAPRQVTRGADWCPSSWGSGACH